MTVVEERYTPEKLAQMHDALWKCVLQFANFSATQERHRIARDLHDSLGHALTALNFQLQTAMQLCKPDPNQAQEFLNEAHNLVKLATSEVRQSVKTLRDDEFETQSLRELVDSLVNDFYRTTGVVPTVEVNLLVGLPSHFVTPIYRIIQEALNNIRKYAKATTVSIEICSTPAQVYVIIQDNGEGFDTEEVCGGYGLRGMQERVGFLQGNFQLESQPGDGCCITVEIPITVHSPNKSEITLTSYSEESSIVNISGISSSLPEESGHPVEHPVDKHRADAQLSSQLSSQPNSQIISEITVHRDVDINESEIPNFSDSTPIHDYGNEYNSDKSETSTSRTTSRTVYIGEWQPLSSNEWN
ncbi:MAG: sensor histidine kinase [Cyanobacteria bacterium P01_A01_bin.45]